MEKIITLLIFGIILFSSIGVNAISNNTKLINSEKYDMVIIAPKNFARSIKPLVVHKNNFGIKTFLKTTEEIFNEYEGRDKAEQVKYFIKDAIENHDISYVLFIGGRKGQLPKERWWVPVRYSHLDRKYDQMIERKFLTDLYFADIYDESGNFSSWDNDGNGIFGEWPESSIATDTPDLYPDICVGRLPCQNRLEVKIIVRKIINYESTPSCDSWFKTMVVIAGDTYPEKTSYYDGEVYTQKGIDNMTGFNAVKLWASDGTFQSWKDVVREFNKGCGFIWFSGHGNPSTWSTHPPDDNENWITGLKLRHMTLLRNKHKQPICITGSGCFNSMFNVSIMNSPWVYGIPIPKCWSWALASKISGGSIATIGATAFSYESPDLNLGFGGIEWLDIHFFEEYGKNNKDILGEAWGDTISAFLDTFPINWNDDSKTGYALVVKNVEQWLLIGDPSLKIGGYN